MNKRRKLVIALGAGALVAPFSFAQSQGKVWRVGFLSSESASGYQSRVDALRTGVRDFGYVEGKNLLMEFRWAEGENDRLPALASELVRLNVDVLVTHASLPTRAAKQATTTIPIVMATVSNPVGLGFVASLARPGGNITGSTFFPTEIAAKRIELLKEILPRVTEVAVLLDPSETVALTRQAIETTARSVGVTLHEFAVRSPLEFDSAFAALVKKRVGAVTALENPIMLANAKPIADLAVRHQMPLICNGEVAEAGGVFGYGADLLGLYRRVGYFVDKIFKGAKPGDLPIEQPTKFDFVVNLKTAKALGIKIPDVIMLRANRVIE